MAQKLHELGVKAGDRVGVAVSGGVDSMVLLHTLCSLRDQLNITVVAFHMEHGIRGRASEDDMRFVMRQCAQRGVECVVERADVPAIAREQKLSVETAARQTRYAFLDRQDADWIATAHQMDDVAETVLMNLLRGCGLSGLCGIPEKRGRYIRPLLHVSRKEIEEYAAENCVEFVRDATNDETGYTRNYIRSEILPRLARVNEQAVAHIAQTAQLLKEDEAALRQAALDAGCIEEKEDGVYIGLDRLAELPEAVKARVIRLAFEKRFGLKDVESKHVQDILRLAADGESAKRLDIGKGLAATVVYGKLMIGRARKKAYNNNSVDFSGPGRYEMDGTVFTCSECSEAAFGDGAEYFDMAALTGAVFRHRREGDFIQPLGMSGTKRLSDYLSDRKVPLYMRDDMVVLAVGSEVLWAVGAGVSEKSKIKPGSRIIKIEVGEKSTMHHDIEQILFTEEQIKQRVKELAAQICKDLKGEDVLTVGVLRGAVMFYADLVREMDIPLNMNFMAVSSYGNSATTSGAVRIQYDLEEDIAGRNVLVVEDIVDSGLTLQYLTKTLRSRNPKSLKTCCLFDKPSRRLVEFKADYVGFEVPDVFIVGYGLDYAEKYRNLKYIGVLKPSVYQSE